MIRALLAASAWLHRWLEEQIGLPYRLLITIGLIVTMAHTVKDLASGGWHTAGWFALILQAGLFLDTATALEARLALRDKRRVAR